jgi:predicted HicB family RNase H-like nuclease
VTIQLQPYKGYEGYIHTADHEDNVLVGRVAGIRDIVTFVGSTLADLQREFQLSLDTYLEHCAGQGKKPNKPANGVFQVRVSPELHRRAAMKAQARKQSLNSWVVEALEAAVGS